MSSGTTEVLVNIYMNFDDMHWVQHTVKGGDLRVDSNDWDFVRSLWSWSYRNYQISFNDRNIDWFFTVDASADNKGQLTFSSPINMVWLEENFSNFFSLYTVTGSGLDAVEADLTDIKLDKTSDDKMVADLSFSGFISTTQRLYAKIVMSEDAYRSDAIFVKSGLQQFNSAKVAATRAESSGSVTEGGLKVELQDDDDDNDTAITWGIVGGFLGFVLIGVGIYCCCLKCACCLRFACCKGNRIAEKEKEERLRVFKNAAIGKQDMEKNGSQIGLAGNENANSSVTVAVTKQP